MPESPLSFPPLRTRTKPARVRLELRGEDFGQLLDFQKLLADLPGVSRASIAAIDNHHATLLVELVSEPASG